MNITMKFKKVFVVLAISSFSLLAFSQKDDTILTIGAHKFTAGEFWHIYNKNKHLPGFNETPEQFSQRFINYKLKVVEAIHEGLDTLPDFISEFTKYRDELAESYLIDSTAIEQSAREAYQHMTGMVNASHILVRFPQNPTPADTLKAWNRIHELRELIVKGEDFNAIAVKYSEDPSAHQNQGKLGYFTAFQMVYPFEKAAFSTQPGEISPVVRTVFGYHLLKVHENIPNPGKIKVAHIMKVFNQQPTPEIDAAARASIDSVYRLLKNGADFAEMARLHSGDAHSASNGGMMQPFGLNDIVPEFTTAAFSLKSDGDISEPIRTPFGWHIIKRIELQPVEDFETLRPMIGAMMSNDERHQAGRIKFIQQKRQSNAFKFNQNEWNKLIQPLVGGNITNDEFFGKVNAGDQKLFTYYTTSVTTGELINYAQNNPLFNAQEGIVGLEKSLDELISVTITNTEKERLSAYNDHFKYLSNEYHDGLLIFEISDREIWSKANIDSTALHNHYLNNPLEFSTPPVLSGSLCYSNNIKFIQKLEKELKKNPATPLSQILIKVKAKKSDYKLYEGDYPFLHTSSNPVEAVKLPDTNPLFSETGMVFWQGTIASGEVIPYENCRGMVISSYQNNLEKQWVEELQNKHNPVFNTSLLKLPSGKKNK